AMQSRPRVIVQWRYVPAPQFGVGDGWDYVARNLGPGRALDVTLFLGNASGATPYALGTMDPGDTVRLQQEVIDAMNQHASKSFVMFSDASGQRLFVTENRITTGHRVVHRFGEHPMTADELDALLRGALGEYISREWVQREYDSELTNEVGRA